MSVNVAPISPAVLLAPTPGSVRGLRITYIPTAQELAIDADRFDGINGYEEMVLQKMLLLADFREERNTTERERLIAKHEQRVMSSAPGRDAGEPQRLSDHVEGVGDDFEFTEEFWW